MMNTKQRYYLELCTCFAIAMIVFWLYSHFTKVPIIHGDESGYLLNAAAFAGYRTDAFSSYYPAYSVPISLAFWGGTTPDQAYDIIQAINAAFWGAAACLAYALLVSLRPQSPLRQRALVVAVTLLYPAYPVFASLALSENLFVPGMLLLAFVLYRQGERPSWSGAVLVGALVAMLTLAHPKGALVGVAAAMAMVLDVRMRPVPVLSRLAVTVLTAAALYLSLRGWLDSYLRDMLNAKDLTAYDHYPGMKEILEDAARIFTAAGMARFFGVMSGQGLYLIIASLGLVFVGGAWCVRRILDRAGEPGERTLAVFSLFSLLGVYAFSVFFMKEGIRADHIMYGRYSESVIGPLLLLGALCLPARRELKWAAIVAAVLATLVLLLQGNPISGSIVVMNITAVDAVRKFFPGVLNVVGLAIVGAAFILAIGMVRNRTAAMVVILVLFVANALVFGRDYLDPGSRFRGKQHSLVRLIERDFPNAECVNYDMGSMSPWERNNYQFYLLPMRLDSVAGKNLFECGVLLISSATDLSAAAPDAVLIGQEFGSDQKLWIKRAALQDWLRQQPPLEIPEGGLSVGTLNKQAPKGLGSGWYGKEDWGIWSKPSAYIILAPPSRAGRSLRLDYDVLATATVPRTLRINCNGKTLASREYRQSTSESIMVGAAELASNGCSQDARIVLQVEIMPAASPSQLGMSADARQMGIGLKQLAWVDGPR